MVGTCVPCVYQNACELGQARARSRGAQLVERGTQLKLCVGVGQKLKKQRDDARAWTVLWVVGVGVVMFFGGYAVGKVTRD